jgi:hypothetical protein
MVSVFQDFSVSSHFQDQVLEAKVFVRTPDNLPSWNSASSAGIGLSFLDPGDQVLDQWFYPLDSVLAHQILWPQILIQTKPLELGPVKGRFSLQVQPYTWQDRFDSMIPNAQRQALPSSLWMVKSPDDLIYHENNQVVFLPPLNDWEAHGIAPQVAPFILNQGIETQITFRGTAEIVASPASSVGYLDLVLNSVPTRFAYESTNHLAVVRTHLKPNGTYQYQLGMKTTGASIGEPHWLIPLSNLPLAVNTQPLTVVLRLIQGWVEVEFVQNHKTLLKNSQPIDFLVPADNITLSPVVYLGNWSNGRARFQLDDFVVRQLSAPYIPAKVYFEEPTLKIRELHNSIRFVASPPSVEWDAVAQIEIDYIAQNESDILIDLLDPQRSYAWHGSVRRRISEGRGRVKLALLVIDTPPPRGGYIFQASLLPPQAYPEPGRILVQDQRPVQINASHIPLPPPPPSDLDHDGVNDAKETELGTQIGNPDSDGDLLSDGDEIYESFTDPAQVSLLTP